jgi:hypothetical protein
MCMDDDDLVTRCPICKADPEEEECGHLLASFDVTFSEGFHSCDLSGVIEMRELLDQIHHDCALVLTGEPITSWLEGVRADSAVKQLVQALLDVDASGYESFEDLVCDLPGNADDYYSLERELLAELVERGGQGIGYTFRSIDSMPGMSSSYETWWCDDPSAAADCLGKEANFLLGRPEGLGGKG